MQINWQPNQLLKYPSPGHEVEVAAFIRKDNEVQDFINSTGANVEAVTFICEQHMRVKRLGEMKSRKRWALMSEQLFPKLCLFTLADKMSNDWRDCFGRWNSRVRDNLPIGNVTVGWLDEEDIKRKEHLASELNKPMPRLTGKDLIQLGFPQGKAIGIAIKLADEHLSEMTRFDLLKKFTKIIVFPSNYLNDECFGSIAKELTKKQSK